MQQTSASPAAGTVPRPAPEAVPRNSAIEAYNLADLRRHAKRVLPKGLFEFVDRGTENELALRTMREALEHVLLRPRVLVDVSQRNQATEFFGRPSSSLG